MVSTRRGANTAPPIEALDTVEASLKRPTRKASSRSAATSGAKATAKKPSTRSKRVAEEVEDVVHTEGEAETSETEVKPQAKQATKARWSKAAPKSKKEVPEETKVQPRMAPRSLRGKPRQMDQEESALQLKPETIPAPSRSKRTTATKAAPLSPKKVTQVARAVPKIVSSNMEENSAAKKPKLQTKTRTRSTRTRQISDENEDANIALSQNGHSRHEDYETDSGRSASEQTEETGPKTRRLVEGGAKREHKTSQALASHKTSTPLKVQTPLVEESSPDELGPDSTHRQSMSAKHEHDTAESDDELLEPKTPMKRLSLTTQSQWRASAQKSTRPLQTPVRDLAARRIQNGTPQTQRLHQRAAHHITSAMPMTEARAVGRSFVFRDLRPLDEDDTEDSTQLEQPSHAHVHEDDSTVVEVPSLDEMIEESSIVEEPTSRATSRAVSPDPADEDEDSSVLVAPELSIVAMSDYVDDDSDMLSETGAWDGDAARDAILRANELDSAAGDAEETVIVTRREDEEEEIDDNNDFIDPTEDHLEGTQFEDSALEVTEIDVSTFDASEHSIETIPWRRLRPDVTIPVNFEAHLQGIDCLPQGEPTERLSISGDTILAAQEQQMDLQTGESLMLSSTANADDLSMARDADDEDLSLHVSEFIDVASLTEPTGQNEWPETILQDVASAAEVSDMDMGPDMDVTGLINDVRNEDIKAGKAPSGEEDVVEQCQESAVVNDEAIPHYARPTLAFDARRKSLPAVMLRTPTKQHSRPHTSDGASVPRTFANWEEPWWIRSRREAQKPASVIGTPTKPQLNMASVSRSVSGPSTPKRSSIAPSIVATPQTSTQERYPRLNTKLSLVEHPQTTIAPSRYRTPVPTGRKLPATVGKVVGDRLLKSAQPTPLIARPITPANVSTPSVKQPQNMTPQAITAERYPRLGARQNYSEHAATVTGPRFSTPTHATMVKRSMTAQKAATSRKVPLHHTSHNPVRTPVKKPLKSSAITPSQEPLTPHPAAPLRGVVALVEVFTNEGASASAPFVQLLHRLGAKTIKSWCDRITHVVFKDGSPTTLQRVRLHNKEVAESNAVHCVNSRWVTNCDAAGAHLDETEEQYAVDIEELPRGGKRRRKSMEPSALANVGGSVVRDRQSSYGRSSLGRASLGRSSIGPSPLKKQKSADGNARAAIRESLDTMASVREDALLQQQQEDSSPVTPAWIAAPDTLVQQTAPLNRMRKLQVKDNGKGNRRLTFYNGAF